jgi:hypothetical protein
MDGWAVSEGGSDMGGAERHARERCGTYRSVVMWEGEDTLTLGETKEW